MPRHIENQRIPSTNSELQRKAGGGIMKINKAQE